LADLQVALAWNFRDTGQLREALHLGQEALALSRRAFGPSDLDVASKLLYLGITYRFAGENDKSRACLEEALSITSKHRSERYSIELHHELALALHARD
jgi:tetratricopeptide (TPR) repeat protein